MTDEERKIKKNEYLSITQIAKYKNISPDTLRFYDKINLFKPDYIDPMNGRRYYSPEQCDKLGIIMELRNMQVSIKDIKEFMEKRTLDKSEKILMSQVEYLDKEINRQQQLKILLEEKLEFIDKQRKKEFKLNIPMIKKLPDRYALIGNPGATQSIKVAVEYMNLERKISGVSPVFASNNIGMEIPSNLVGNLHDEIIRPVVFLKKGPEKKEKIQKIPGGKYVCMYLKNERGDLKSSIDSLREAAHQSGYKLGENGYIIYQIDITLTDEKDETLVEIQFPIGTAVE